MEIEGLNFTVKLRSFHGVEACRKDSQIVLMMLSATSQRDYVIDVEWFTCKGRC
jgi:hypothetical protein